MTVSHETPSPMEDSFAKLPSTFKEPLPRLDHVIEDDPATQASEKADWGKVSSPTIQPTIQTRGPVLRPDREIPAHASSVKA